MDKKRIVGLSDTEVGPTSDLYVVRGLTPERADALRQTLTVPGNGPEVQVTVQSAEGLATTQPSVEAAKDIDALKAGNGNPGPTSRPAEPANFALSMAPATTAPSEGLSAGETNGGSVGVAPSVIMANNSPAPLSANQSQSLPPVDAVIVFQTTAVAGNPAAPATQPAPMGRIFRGRGDAGRAFNTTLSEN